MTLRDEITELAKGKEDAIRGIINNIAEKDRRCGELAYTFGNIVKQTSLHEFKGSAYFFNGRVYEEISEQELDLMVLDSMEDFGVFNSDIAARKNMLIGKCHREARRKKLEPSKRVLSFDNGVLDLDTCKLEPVSDKNHVLSMVPYSYKSDATCPLWDKFLTEVLPDKNDRYVLQEYLGAIFIDRKKTSLEKMLILYGTGSNGKSVVYNTIKGILGEANISVTPLEDLVNGARVEHNIASIDGKLLNYCSELGKKELSGRKVKSLVSGEECPARMLFKDSYVARNIPLIIANANALPDTTDDSHGYFRRFLILGFKVMISDAKQDHNLADKLKKEYSGIFNWILAGRTRFTNNNYRFTESESVNEVAKNYEMDSNSVLSFLREHRIFSSPLWGNHNPHTEMQVDIYRKYCTYCSENGYKAFSSKAFRDKLIARGFFYSRNSRGQYFRTYPAPPESECSLIVASGGFGGSVSEFKYLCGYSELEEPEVTIEEVEEVISERELELEFNNGSECP